MSKLTLSVATGNYDRIRPIVDGTVQIDGVDPICLMLSPEEIFFRAFRHAEFDICELSLSSFAIKQSHGTNEYVGVPVFPSRAFRHTSIYVRKDRISKPSDLKGRRIGIPEYQLTANVWARGILSDHGVEPNDVVWIRGGLEQAVRPEKISLSLPQDIRIEAGPQGKSLSQMIIDGDIDGIITPRMPSAARAGSQVGWLFDDPTAAAKSAYANNGIFPIMHLVGIRKSLVESNPWLPGAVLKAFEMAKAAAIEMLEDTSATKVTLPFIEEQLAAARRMMGDDYWPYGFARNKATLETFLRFHHGQGLSTRKLEAEELFCPTTLESFSV